MYTSIQLSFFFFFSSRRRHTRLTCDWSSDVCSSDLASGTTQCSSPGAMTSRPSTADSTEIDGVITPSPKNSARSEERRVGKSVDLGGRRIIKKKKEKERE